MKDKIKAICLSRNNILSASVTLFLFLKDVQEVITGFATHLFLIVLSISILFVLLGINFYLTKSGDLVLDNHSDAKTVNRLQFDNADPEGRYGRKNGMMFSKVIFSIILFITLTTIGSLYYIKNIGVYYVVLNNKLTIEQASKLKYELNSSEEFTSRKLSTRVIPNPEKKGLYELILYNGYINENKAEADLTMIKSMKLDFQPYKTESQFVANFFKKVWYLQNDIFN